MKYKMSYFPKRSCIGCGIKKEKEAFIRIVKNKSGIIFIDKAGKAAGRGAYICNCIKCLEKAKKNRKLEKTLKTKIEENIYDNLRGVISDK